MQKTQMLNIGTRYEAKMPMLALRKLPIRERATRPSASPSCHLSWCGVLVGGEMVCGAVMVMMRSTDADRCSSCGVYINTHCSNQQHVPGHHEPALLEGGRVLGGVFQEHGPYDEGGQHAQKRPVQCGGGEGGFEMLRDVCGPLRCGLAD